MRHRSQIRQQTANKMQLAKILMVSLGTLSLSLSTCLLFPLVAPLPLLAQPAGAKDRKTEAEQLYQLGVQQDHRAEYPKALESFQKALALFKQTNNRKGEGNTLVKLGITYSHLGQYAQALEFFQQALVISQGIEDLAGKGTSLKGIGFIHYIRGQYHQALEFYHQALTILRASGERLEEGSTLNNIGSVYYRQGLYPQALKFYQQALAIRKEIRDQSGESTTLNNVGNVYNNLGQYPQALEFFQQALAIRKKIGDRSGEGNSLNSIGSIYHILGQYSKALEFYQQALAIGQAIGNRAEEGTTLDNIGSFYRDLGQYTQALKFHQQALAIRKQIGDRFGEGNSLNSIGFTYDKMGQHSRALEFYQQALSIRRTISDHLGEGITLNNIGSISYKQRQRPNQTFESFQQALVIQQSIGDRAGIGTTFNNIAYLLLGQKQTELAIVFLKQSVNTYEQIRGDLKVLPKEQQQSYTETVASTYRRLADLLLQQDRVLEAQQVLDLLKVQELDDYLGDVRGTGQKLEFLQPELEILKRYNALQQTAIQVGTELAQLRKLDSQNALAPDQQQRLTHLAQLETDINAQFNAFIDSDPIQKLTAQLIRVTRNQNLNLEDLASLRDDLRQLNAALIYPLILEDRLELVITTPNAPPLRRVVQVKRTDLNRTIQQFRSALGTRQDTTQALAQQLYTWLIQPLEADLKQAKVKTLIYAPDGQLRYIPLAALHDGNQWLIQQYRIQNITARSVTDLDIRPTAKPQVLAAAFGTAAKTVVVGNESFPFPGLPYATPEVQALTQKFDPVVSLFDASFNRKALLTRMNSFTMVHLATHGKFLIGKPDDSFLVTGDGQPINLKEIKNLPMSNVDLVVLSACETGIGITDQANGVEVLGLGYQFQRAGAKAAIASLWPVNDGSTQQFMEIFYGLLQQGVPKAEALQQAQIALITGDYTAGGKLRGNFHIEFKSDAKPIATNLQHPFYWAPFILIGNGR